MNLLITRNSIALIWRNTTYLSQGLALYVLSLLKYRMYGAEVEAGHTLCSKGHREVKSIPKQRANLHLPKNFFVEIRRHGHAEVEPRSVRVLVLGSSTVRCQPEVVF